MYKHIGKYIQNLREDIGLNQEELAAKIGKSKSLISYIETNGKVNDSTLKVLAKALNVSFESLKIYPYVNVDPKSDENERLKKENQDLQREIKLLNKVIEGQEKLIRMFESQLKK